MAEKRFKILICDGMVAEGLAIFEKEPRFEVINQKGIPREELLAKVPECEGVVVRSATKIDKEAIEAGKRLKVVARAGVGMDNIDVEAATQRGVVVMNTPDGNTTSAAEHTMALMLSLLRNIPKADAKMRTGGWDRNKFTGHELFGKTLGIIGLGRIGRQVAKRAQSFEMKTIGADPFASAESAARDGIELVDLDRLLATSDIITLHTPATEETRGMIGKANIAKMKKGVFLVNCARGALIVDDDLAEALKSGQVAGAAIDVYTKEPPENCPLVGLENVVTTPHLGASTEEAQINVGITIAHQMIDALLEREVRNAANMPLLGAEDRRVLGPFIKLADELGQFAGQIVEGSLEKVEVHFQGEVASRDISPLTTAALRGAISNLMPETVNYVNAPVLAKMRGLKVESSSDTEATGFTNLVTVSVTTPKGTRSVSGTVFEGQDASRIVAIDDYMVEAKPLGHILLIRNKDQAGVVGLVGTVLAKNGINISSMSIGPHKKEPVALGVINVDQPVPPEALVELKSSDLILSARSLRIA